MTFNIQLADGDGKSISISIPNSGCTRSQADSKPRRNGLVSTVRAHAPNTPRFVGYRIFTCTSSIFLLHVTMHFRILE